MSEITNAEVLTVFNQCIFNKFTDQIEALGGTEACHIVNYTLSLMLKSVEKNDQLNNSVKEIEHYRSLRTFFDNVLLSFKRKDEIKLSFYVRTFLDMGGVYFLENRFFSFLFDAMSCDNAISIKAENRFSFFSVCLHLRSLMDGLVKEYENSNNEK